MSPFQALMGYEPKAIPTTYKETNIPAVEKRIKQLQQIREEAMASHELARRRMKERGKAKFEPFKLGQLVLLDTRNIPLQTPNRKLGTKREGPFKIIEVLSDKTYKLQLPWNWKKIHPVFNAVLLTKYSETDEHGPNYHEPPPDLVEGEEEY